MPGFFVLEHILIRLSRGTLEMISPFSLFKTLEVLLPALKVASCIYTKPPALFFWLGVCCTWLGAYLLVNQCCHDDVGMFCPSLFSKHEMQSFFTWSKLQYMYSELAIFFIVYPLSVLSTSNNLIVDWLK